MMYAIGWLASLWYVAVCFGTAYVNAKSAFYPKRHWMAPRGRKAKMEAVIGVTLVSVLWPAGATWKWFGGDR